MASPAYDGGLTLAPFRRMYDVREGLLLSDTLFSVPDRFVEPEPAENDEAITPQVIPMPDRARFEAAVATWLQDIRLDSFPADMKDHDSFGEIIAQGFGVVPLIAAQLRRQPSFLFLALEEIFGEDPVPENAYGKLSTVTAAWLEWLKR